MLGDAYEYLVAPKVNSLTNFTGYGTLPERGTAWLFLRAFYVMHYRPGPTDRRPPARRRGRRPGGSPSRSSCATRRARSRRMRNGNNVCTQRLLNRSSDRLSCTSSGVDASAWTSAVCGVKPAGNRMLVFTTSLDSFHGHPDPLTCPDDVARRSMRLFGEQVAPKLA